MVAENYVTERWDGMTDKGKAVYPPVLRSGGIKISNTVFSVESSLFVGDQHSWILWVTFTPELTSQRTCYIFLHLYNNYAIHIIYELPTKLHPQEPVKIWLLTSIGPHELK